MWGVAKIFASDHSKGGFDRTPPGYGYASLTKMHAKSGWSIRVTRAQQRKWDKEEKLMRRQEALDKATPKPMTDCEISELPEVDSPVDGHRMKMLIIS